MVSAFTPYCCCYCCCYCCYCLELLEEGWDSDTDNKSSHNNSNNITIKKEKDENIPKKGTVHVLYMYVTVHVLYVTVHDYNDVCSDVHVRVYMYITT